MEKPILALVPSAEKSLKVYSVLPVNGDGDFELRRNGAANRINKDGLIEFVLGSNNPRLNWSSECPSLLLEGTSTNLQIRSEEFDNAAWGKTRITVTANDTISPDGTESADKVECNSTGSAFLTDAIGIGSTDDITFSTFIKSGNAQYCSVGFYDLGFGSSYRVVFDLHNEAITYELVQGSVFTNTSVSFEKYSNGWFRICTSALSTGTTNIRNYIYPVTNGATSFTATQGQYNYIWGAQAELKKFCSSYIKTEGSIATRNKETRVATGLYGDPEFNKNEGVAFIDVKPFPVDASDTSGNIISLRGGSYSLMFFRFRTNNVLEFYAHDAPAGSAIFDYDLAHNGGRIKAAIRWNNGNYSIFANGQLLNSYLNTSRFFTDLETFQFQQSYSFNEFEGEVYEIQVFDEALDNNEIAKLTEL